MFYQKNDTGYCYCQGLDHQIVKRFVFNHEPDYITDIPNPFGKDFYIITDNQICFKQGSDTIIVIWFCFRLEYISLYCIIISKHVFGTIQHLVPNIASVVFKQEYSCIRMYQPYLKSFPKDHTLGWYWGNQRTCTLSVLVWNDICNMISIFAEINAFNYIFPNYFHKVFQNEKI